MNLFNDDFSDDEGEEEKDDDFSSLDEPTGDFFTHSRGMNYSFGHAEQEQRLLQLFQSKRMPQALIFSGPPGIGKATMAYRFARFLLNDDHKEGQGGLFGGPAEPEPASTLDVAPDNPVFRRVASGAHADLLSIERAYDDAKNRYKESVDVDSVRKVAPFLRKTASEGGWRVVIIDDADTMNRNAQNALLKILEEPPKKTVLVLVAHRMGALIPTIRSRAQMLHFHPLLAADLMAAVQKHSPAITTDQAAFIAAYAHGSLGRALGGLDQDMFEIFENIAKLWRTWPDFNGLSVYALAEEISGHGKDLLYEIFQKLLFWLLGMLANAKARNIALDPQIARGGAFTNFLEKSSLEDILKICENLGSHFGRANAANLDKKQNIISAFSLIAP